MKGVSSVSLPQVENTYNVPIELAQRVLAILLEYVEREDMWAGQREVEVDGVMQTCYSFYFITLPSRDVIQEIFDRIAELSTEATAEGGEQ